MKTIIPLSGGLDSTYALWKLLSETSDEVTALFVNMDNFDTAWNLRYDLRGFSGGDDPTLAFTVFEWLKQNVRTFTLLNHSFDTNNLVRGFGKTNNPQVYATRYAIPKINEGEYDRISFAVEKENDGWSNGGTINFRRPGSIAAREIFVATAQRGSIDFPLVTSNYTQANALFELPKPLLDIIIAYSENDTSFKYKKKQWLKSLLNEGKTTEEIYGIWYSKCTVYPDKWFSMKYWINDVEPTEQNTWSMPEWPTSYTVPEQ